MNTGTATLANALEQRLGDPFDSANPYGFAALLAAAEAGRTPDGEAWHVPAGDPEPVLHALRAVHRRSPASGPAPVPTSAAFAVGACVGALDSALRITLRHLRARRLYGAAAIDLPALRVLLSGAFADLLLCDTLATLAVRGTDALPARPGAAGQALAALGPRALQGALDRLSVVMGSRFYIRVGEHAAFQRLLGETQRALFAAADRTATPEPDHAPAALSDLLSDLLATPAVAALCDPQLLAAAPGCGLTGRARRAPQPAGPVHERLYGDLLDRYESGRSFDLTRRALPDRPLPPPPPMPQENRT
ncbi:hypothetical protein [Streptomyces sp. 1331.2]|uniref:hypothetical protein n=1 Tax=Streptomyces sp. 1331.2 TaxID=1938835 RepID=UPI000BCFE973|nr:hypothetical protein [Streptomyces sp. 1331.2]SOB81289.1 hypothetical protein SAMN06272789_1415 [Streptomyces sp. 1331.2]